MRIFYTLLFFFCIFLPSGAADIVYRNGQSLSGRVTMSSDGLIMIKSNGIEHSIVRSKDNGFFGDYIRYRPNAFSSETVETNCRLLFVDFYSVTFQTPDVKIKIPRYRVKSMILNTD